MKFYFPETTTQKSPLPVGSINIRFRQMRCVSQAFAGSTYLTLADGETDEEVIENLKRFFDVPAGTIVTSHTSNTKRTFTI